MQSNERDQQRPSIPSKDEVQAIMAQACQTLGERYFSDTTTGAVSVRVCAVCDRMATVGNRCEWQDMHRFQKWCDQYRSRREDYPKEVFPPQLVEQYIYNESPNVDRVLSPRLCTREDETGNRQVLVCEECYCYMVNREKSRRKNAETLNLDWSIGGKHSTNFAGAQ